MVMATSSLPRRRGGLDERRKRVKRGCGEVVCSRSSEHPTQSTEIQPQHAWGATRTMLSSLSFAPHLARPRGKIGRVSRLQPLILPSGPSHWSTREVRGRIPLGHDHDIVSNTRSGDTASFRESDASEVCASASKRTQEQEWVGRKERRCRKQEN
jgi:hypothetical protein